ncbi:MAG: hypothetical protein HYX63_19960 [Gammaproteobacteria bacterium]|nr:hypothetical protein [Gammaproteobacteria bacterium]
MEKLTLTTLRRTLFEVADRVLQTGISVAVERRGKTLLISAGETPSRLSRLKRRKLIRGTPESLLNITVGEWRELQNLG